MKCFLTNFFAALLACLLFGTTAVAQQDYRVRFRNHTEIFPENYKQLSANPLSMQSGEAVNGLVYRYLQFYKIPTAAQRAEMGEKGLRFFGYTRFAAYLVGIPADFDLATLEPFEPRSLVAASPDWKVSPGLRERPFGTWAVRGDEILVNAQVYPNIGIDEAAERFAQSGVTVVFRGKQNGFLQIQISPEMIDNVALMPFVRHLELVPPPGKKEDTGGRSIHRSNLVNSDAPMGRHFDGAGVGVLCRDDGHVGPHIDFRGRQHDLASDNPGQTHGDGVSGIMAGAGNLDPRQRGMASGADLWVIDYVNHFQDNTLDLHLIKGVEVTNSSYSDGCNDGYTLATQTVDQQMHQYPSLMHVFSAGNAGETNCDYGVGAFWGNITGGHKMAKNTIATANLHADGALESTSSRGPAYDGRLKPDIAAHGQNQGSTTENYAYQVFGGTSGAAPGIAGVLGQLHQAFREIENVQHAPAALLKAALLNTANDMGNPGPDFKFGWGHVNAWRALRLLEEKRWLKSSVEQGTPNQPLLLNIPAGVRQARVMIYWADPESEEGNDRALINDLDLTLTAPNGSVHRPLILNPRPVIALLDAPAQPGRDSLNNMEQVRLEDPAPGDYIVKVNGFEVPFGPQEFFVVWEFLTDEVKITYPGGGEGFVPGEKERIHWDAHGNTTIFTLRYTRDGVNWQNIATLDADKRMYEWTVPATATGQARLMLERGGLADTTDYPFTIAALPPNVEVVKVCPDSLTLGFDKINDTLHYDGYLLGQKYMEIKGTSATNSITMPIQNAGAEKWVAARASHPSGLAGRRSVALRYPGGLKNCPQPFDLSAAGVQSPSGDAILKCDNSPLEVTILVKNDGQNLVSGAKAWYKVGANAPVVENLPDIAVGENLSFTFQQTVSLAGLTQIALSLGVTFPDDLVLFNDTIVKTYPVITQPASGLYLQNFEGASFPPYGWQIGNPDNSVTWSYFNFLPAGVNGSATSATGLRCFAYGTRGAEDQLLSIPIRLTGVTKPALSFAVAHARYSSSYTERLRVEVIPSCDVNATPVLVYDKADPDLATTNSSLSEFSPESADDWRTEIIDLAQFAGQTIIVRFISTNDYGNNIYLDQVRIIEYNISAPQSVFTYDPGLVCRGDSILFSSQATGNFLSYKWIFGAQAQPSSETSPGPHWVRYITPGDKTARLIVTNNLGTDTATQIITVFGQTTANFASSIAQNTVTFNNTSAQATSYLWNFGDGNTSTEKNPTHTYAATGTYTVKLTASNPCKVAERVAEVVITTVGASELESLAAARIVPNPNAGSFQVEIEASRPESLRFDLLDATGRLVKSAETAVKQGLTRIPFDHAGLAKGVYQLKIYNGTGLRTLKVIVNE